MIHRPIRSVTLPAVLPVAALCAGLLAGPASADITPQALWQAWQDHAAAAGHGLTAAVTDGKTLALAGLTLDRPLGTGTITLRIDRMTLAPDGADVRAALPAGGRVTLTATPGADDPDGETVTAVFALGDAALDATATGAATDPVWTVAADAVALTLVSLTSGGEPVPAEMRLDLAGLAGTLTGLGPGAPLAADLRADRLASEIAATDPDTGDTVRSTATQSNTTLRATLTEDATDPLAWRLDASLASGASEAVSLRSGPTGTFEADSRQDSATLDLTMTDNRTDYTAQVAGIATTLSGSLLPAGPFGAAMDSAAVTLSLPAGPAGPDAGLQTARVDLDLTGVRPDDRLWALIDPAGALPRDPATATLRAEVDLGSPAPGATAPDGTDLPGLLPRALRVAEFAVTLGTASLSGDGALDIPAGPMGVPDMAQGTGALDLRAAGLNGLLQRAMAAGALTTEQMMGAQMMLGMFATPGEGDSFTSRVELLPGGGVVVNGTQVR